MYFPTGSSTDSFPSSWSIRTAVAVTGLVIDAIQKIVSARIGLPAATSALPAASRCTTFSGVATSVTAPATSLSSMSGFTRSRIAGMAGGLDSPGESWPACESGVGNRKATAPKRIASANLGMARTPVMFRLQESG